jgi:TolB-like protein/tetratricopeptide (TPR) repeat protein
VTEPLHAVFLSYASQDAEAAERICQALRAAGIVVWFDQNELRGGDAWDQSIRKQIRTCSLFLPIISHTTHDRVEGYFRLEWKLAVDRSHLIAADQAFLLPVVIDDTRDDDERVPERFREVQWTRLPGGATPAAFVKRVKRLLSGEPTQGQSGSELPAARVSGAPASRKPILASWRSKTVFLATVAVVVVALAYLVANRLVLSKRGAEVGAATAAPAIAFAPPPHSIAVLPFVNMSGDKDQEYFSEGLTEELLNSLSRITELQVAARTSSFSFQGEHPDIATVARKLNVGAVLEGSVRRSARTVRVTAQLVSGVTGFHVWSQTYDRDLVDVLALQTEIATAVATALKMTLLGDVAGRVELGGTRNPAAFDAYLQGSHAYRARHGAKDLETAITAYTAAIRLDPNYAMAFVGRSRALDELASWWIPSNAVARETFAKAQVDAHKAVALAPELGESHLVLANALAETLDFTRASEQFERALALAPGNALVLQDYGIFAASMGRFDAGIAAARQAVVLDPLNPDSYVALATTYFTARQYEKANAVIHDILVLDPNYAIPYQWEAQYLLGDYQGVRTACENRPYGDSAVCLAMTYDKLGRHADAEAQLAKFKAGTPNPDDWYQYAMIYAQWGDTKKALGCLEDALRIRHVALEYLKTDPILDPLRKEPRFQAIERELKFPD